MPFAYLPRADYGTRASGFYGYPGHLSGFLEMALMLGLGLTFWSRLAPWVKMLIGYVCGMCLLGILITGSRGGYISTAVGLLVFGLLSLVSIGRLAPGHRTSYQRVLSSARWSGLQLACALIHEPAEDVSFVGQPLGSSVEDAFHLVPNGLEIPQTCTQGGLQVGQRIEQTVMRRPTP